MADAPTLQMMGIVDDLLPPKERRCCNVRTIMPFVPTPGTTFELPVQTHRHIAPTWSAPVEVPPANPVRYKPGSLRARHQALQSSLLSGFRRTPILLSHTHGGFQEQETYLPTPGSQNRESHPHHSQPDAWRPFTLYTPVTKDCYLYLPYRSKLRSVPHSTGTFSPWHLPSNAGR
ncbi:Hypothetical predicted protein [Pelobates cultripes]|uniref:Uncharacterized protein n=1 Tax=Pelobates cultripes TaxID=61616 RepID=A0AAD1TLG3_PELCU|nr:Hypothetical predicted protein [Pelobates cultripes]